MDRTFIDALAEAITRGNELECNSIIRRYKGDTYRLISMVYYGYYSLTTQGLYHVIESRHITSILTRLYNKDRRSVVIDMYGGCRDCPTIIYKNRHLNKKTRQVLSAIKRKHYHNIGVYAHQYVVKNGADDLFETVVDYFTTAIGCSDKSAVMAIWNLRSLRDDLEMNLIRIMSIVSELLML